MISIDSEGNNNDNLIIIELGLSLFEGFKIKKKEISRSSGSIKLNEFTQIVVVFPSFHLITVAICVSGLIERIVRESTNFGLLEHGIAIDAV